MSCCGHKRSYLPQPGPSRGGGSVSPPGGGRQSAVYFEYLGPTAMTVQGPVSGHRYRFNGPGAVLQVDLRDRASLAAVPRLRQLAGWERR